MLSFITIGMPKKEGRGPFEAQFERSRLSADLAAISAKSCMSAFMALIWPSICLIVSMLRRAKNSAEMSPESRPSRKLAIGLFIIGAFLSEAEKILARVLYGYLQCQN
jgi:hypothetical protein